MAHGSEKQAAGSCCGSVTLCFWWF